MDMGYFPPSVEIPQDELKVRRHYICKECGTIKHTNAEVAVSEWRDDGRARLSVDCHCGNDVFNVQHVIEHIKPGSEVVKP